MKEPSGGPGPSSPVPTLGHVLSAECRVGRADCASKCVPSGFPAASSQAVGLLGMDWTVVLCLPESSLPSTCRFTYFCRLTYFLGPLSQSPNN